jgi:toxin ParE1/3/4
MRIAYTRRALQNLTHHATIIAKDNPAAARDQVARVRATINRLGEFPEMGRPGRVTGTREVSPPRTPFVVIYRVEQECIVILRVLHERQSYP